MALLVVVDMQPGFTAYEKCLDHVLKLVTKAKTHNVPIVIVELNSAQHGKTVPVILDLVRDYKKVFFVEKSGNDGSRELRNKLPEVEFPITMDKIRVCGVNLDACVADTVVGLSALYPESKIILHQEASHCNSSSELGLKTFKSKQTAPNVLLISQDEIVWRAAG